MHDTVFQEVLILARQCRQVILAGYGEPLLHAQCLPMLRAFDVRGGSGEAVAIERQLTEEEAALVRAYTRSSWDAPDDPYHALDGGQMVAGYASDAISVPSGHAAMRGHDEIRAWYARRTGDHEMNVESDADAIDIVGDVAVLVGVFRVTRRPEQGVAGLDHAGRWLAVLRRIDGEWRMWRDMDTPSPDADVYYDRVPRGQ
jgi:ketosteroid isomerase-like protein